MIGHRRQRTELGAELMLALRHLVMMLLDQQAHLAHGGQHLGAQIAFAIQRRHREISALHAGTVAHIALRIILHAGLRAFLAVQLIHAVIAAGAEPHAVEHKELGFRPERRDVAHARRNHIRFGLLGRAARIAPIGLAGGRLHDIANQDHRRLGAERIHHRARRIGHQDHVALIDRLPAGDRRAVEHETVAKHILVDGRNMLRRVLPFAARVGEPQIDIFHRILAQQFHHARDFTGF